jgi:hypothetical protein
LTVGLSKGLWRNMTSGTKIHLDGDVSYELSLASSKPLVLSVCTNATEGYMNFVISLERLGYDYRILGMGMTWGGWKWRTKMYLDALEGLEERMVLLVDGTDVLFIGSPEILFKRFREHEAPVIIGSERNCSTGGLRYNLVERAKIMNAYTEISSSPYRYPNGGCVMGYTTPLKRLLYQNKDANDDQEGYTYLHLAIPSLFVLDYGTTLVGNISQHIGMFHASLPEVNEREAWIIEKGSDPAKPIHARNKITGGEPIILHFSGGNWEPYNEVARLLLGPINSEIIDKKPLKQVLKKPWSSSLQWLLPWKG